MQSDPPKVDTTIHLCPFCNAALPPLGAPSSAEKLPCPRCGEPVPAARWHVEPTAIREGPPPLASPHATPGNRPTALVVLGVMATMAVVGLGYMLWTVQDRRARDPKPLLAPVKFRRPLELDGLGYLPKGSQIVVGLQIAELLEDRKVGKPLLDEPKRAGLDWVLKQITRTTGMELTELDHVLAASALDIKSPQLTLVVKTRRPIDLKKIAQAGPVESTLYQQEPLYQFTLKPDGEALVWCIDERTALCVIRFDVPKIDHLQGLSKTPRPIDEVLAAPIRDALKERLAKYQFAWAVGQPAGMARLRDLSAFMSLMPFVNSDVSALTGFSTFAIGLEPIDGLTLTGHFQVGDAKSAASFKKRLDGVKIAGATSQKVEAPPADAKEPWVTWQVRGDVAGMRDWLSSFSAREAPGGR
ncbi:MAG: hypothetical protein EXR98_21200 [Gemmataceae bacterium]|nr:hypothetical protein [Gemmataceae bacterium]